MLFVILFCYSLFSMQFNERSSLLLQAHLLDDAVIQRDDQEVAEFYTKVVNLDDVSTQEAILLQIDFTHLKNLVQRDYNVEFYTKKNTFIRQLMLTGGLVSLELFSTGLMCTYQPEYCPSAGIFTFSTMCSLAALLCAGFCPTTTSEKIERHLTLLENMRSKITSQHSNL